MTTTPELTLEILDSVAPDTESSTQVATAAPVLITEQEVALSTAVAVPVQPTKTRRFAAASSAALAALRSVSEALAPEERAPRRHYPPRHDFLEDARMAREMERL